MQLRERHREPCFAFVDRSTLDSLASRVTTFGPLGTCTCQICSTTFATQLLVVCDTAMRTAAVSIGHSAVVLLQRRDTSEVHSERGP